MQNISATAHLGDGIEAQLLDERQRQFGQRQHALSYRADEQIAQDGAAFGAHHDQVAPASFCGLGDLFGHMAGFNEHVVRHTCFVQRGAGRLQVFVSQLAQVVRHRAFRNELFQMLHAAVVMHRDQYDRYLGSQRSRIFDSAQSRSRTICRNKDFHG